MGQVVSDVVDVAVGAVTGFILSGGNPLGAIIGAAAGLGLGLAASMSTNTATQTRLSKTLDINAFRKIVYGQTVVGSDIRYWEVHGKTGYTEVVAAATHKMTSIGPLYLSSELVRFGSATPVATCAGTTSYTVQNDGTYTTASTSKYQNVYRRTIILEGSKAATASYLPIAGGNLWNTTCIMTGCAYYINDYTYTAANFPSGIPTSGTQTGQGAAVYDPRRDSTVTGGSGAHRIGDQTTWTYLDLDSNGVTIGSNNALQMLHYLIGYKINGVLVCGMGVDPNDIDINSFITAANNCELQQYYSACTLSTGDSHSGNRQILAAASCGDINDPGGLWTYNVAVNDTANIAVAFTADDIVSAVSFSPADSISTKYNQVGGSYIEPAPPLFYQPQPYPLVSDPVYIAADQGRKNRLNVDFQAVQNQTQAQKLARIILNKNRLTGEFKATFNMRAINALYFNCVTVSFPPLGMVNRLFRVTAMAINPMGGIDLTLRDELASVYTGGTIATPLPPSSGAAYNAFEQIILTNLGATPIIINGTTVNGVTTQAQDGVELYWDAAPANVQYAEVQYSVVGAASWTPAGQVTPDIVNAQGQQTINIAPLLSQTQYVFRVRYVSISNVPGAWYQVGQLTGSATVVVAFDTAHINGVPVADITAAVGANTTNVAAEILRGAAYRAYTDALLQINGQPIATVITDYQSQSSDDGIALVQKFSLLGAANAGNTSFILNASTIEIATPNIPLGTLSNALEGVLGVGTAAGDAAALASQLAATAQGSANTANSGANPAVIAVTTQVNLLSQTVGGQTVTINGINQIVNGIVGESLNVINSNGFITGYEVIGGPTYGDFYIFATSFGIIDPSTNQSYFSLSGGVARLANVEIDTLAVNSVSTANIKAFAVTQAWETDDTNSIALGTINSAAKLVAGVTATTTGHPMEVFVNVQLNNNSNNHDANFSATLYDAVNGGSPTLIKTYTGRVGQNSANITGGALEDKNTFFRYATPAAMTVGNHVFTFYAQLTGGVDSQLTKTIASIFITEFRDQTS